MLLGASQPGARWSGSVLLAQRMSNELSAVPACWFGKLGWVGERDYMQSFQTGSLLFRLAIRGSRLPGWLSHHAITKLIVVFNKTD